MSENGGSNKCNAECVICGGMVNLMTSQALYLTLPNGEEIKVRFHSTCYLMNPEIANNAIWNLYHEKMKALI